MKQRRIGGQLPELICQLSLYEWRSIAIARHSVFCDSSWYSNGGLLRNLTQEREYSVFFVHFSHLPKNCRSLPYLPYYPVPIGSPTLLLKFFFFFFP